MEYPLEQYLPSWAIKASDGTYMEVGAQLLTRDGRRMGNAYVHSLEFHPELGELAFVITDMGNHCLMTRRELEEMFYPPKYVMDPVEARKTRTMKGNQ